MEIVLKYAHLLFVLVAIVLFILCFYWQKTNHANAHKVVFKKSLQHTHLSILVIGVVLIWVKQINPFAVENYFLIEKTIAFIAYSVMVSVSLNTEKRKGMQFLAFIGAFGWLAYIGMLVSSKQAILLLG